MGNETLSALLFLNKQFKKIVYKGFQGMKNLISLISQKIQNLIQLLKNLITLISQKIKSLILNLINDHLTISFYVNILLFSSHSSIPEVFFFAQIFKKILVILIFLNTGALFIIIQFGYYPRVPKFWVPNPHGYPRVIPKKTQNFELYGYPTRKYPWNSDTNPTQPIPKIWFGSGYYPWVPRFWVPNPHPNID